MRPVGIRYCRTMKILGKLPVWVAIAALASQATAETAVPLTTLARLPVKEITVFKDDDGSKKDVTGIAVFEPGTGENSSGRSLNV